MAAKKTAFAWQFQRMGGLDQAVLRTAEDLRRLEELDPKLWVALSCPTTGLEFDARTLALLDTDRDGRIRIPEVVAAVKWACARLKRPDDLVDAAPPLRLDAIDDATPEGARLLATARAILAGLGKAEAETLAQDDVTAAAAHASAQLFNGDGILTDHPGLDDDVRRFVADALAVVGGVEDASGAPGVDAQIARAFMKTATDWLAWRRGVRDASTPLGADTPEAWELLVDLRPKIDDYFLRAELAAYAPNARAALNFEEAFAATPAPGLLQAASLAEFPLARVEPDAPLRLDAGLNPAWRGKMERFVALFAPLLAAGGGDARVLTRDAWRRLQEQFAPYAEAIKHQPAPTAAPVTFPAAGSVDKLGEERLCALAGGDILARFDALAARDGDVPAAAADIAEVERLVLYHRHLYRLLMNFVSFRDFFTLRRAAFQAGTLYIDGRACGLCMPAEKVEEHAGLAGLSQFFLLYCQCRRGVKPGAQEPAHTLGVVAAVTAGDGDLLIPNRNAVFVDNEGRDWDARVVKAVSNPIGLWQAVWSPYKKFGNMIAAQIAKFASDRQTALMDSAGKALGELGAAPAAAPAAAAPAKFDIARNVGLFAAVGLAVGTIGTALAGIGAQLAKLAWWQFPLVIVGIFLVVSGPSVVMAWLKLRQRTLGPLLEASGWAVNGRVKVNFRLSRVLTTEATLPDHARRVFRDPWARQVRKGRLVFWIALLAGALAAGGWFGWRRYRQIRADAVPAGVEADASIPDAMNPSSATGGGEREVRPPAPPAPDTPPPSAPPEAPPPSSPTGESSEAAPVPAAPAA